MFLKPPEHSGMTLVALMGLSPGMNPLPNAFTSVKVCGSPPWSTTETMAPFLITNFSGSKSQPGSGVPASADVNKADSVVLYPSATFRQKSAPAPAGGVALNVTGSHSSNATTWAMLGDLSLSDLVSDPWRCF